MLLYIDNSDLVYQRHSCNLKETQEKTHSYISIFSKYMIFDKNLTQSWKMCLKLLLSFLCRLYCAIWTNIPKVGNKELNYAYAKAKAIKIKFGWLHDLSLELEMKLNIFYNSIKISNILKNLCHGFVVKFFNNISIRLW